ncbi:hypothetical protein SAMN05216597_1640 [Pseudomonas cannabina]|uniref:Uncharacterized protein n=1 Tax=Pseudomonas cannabina TaxID=86840 RepID=A0A0P9MBV4_PSECA|nr:Unknown protein sequence [Pseudomonas cannabina]SDQ91844.1 hypothetical protein SAMN05216597_1640 [Pseudomonas cannabina]
MVKAISDSRISTGNCPFFCSIRALSRNTQLSLSLDSASITSASQCPLIRSCSFFVGMITNALPLKEALIYSIFRPCNALEALIYLGATAGF